DGLSLVAETQRRPPEVRPTAFTARPPNLPPRPLMTLDFAINCSLVRPGRPRYPVFVHRAAALLHAFFRPHLTMTPLRFANPSPPSGWIEDFHLQAVAHTRHTTKTAGLGPPFSSGWMPASSPGTTIRISCRGTTAASGSATDASAYAAPWLRSGGCARASPRTAGRLLPACGRCSCRCRSACAGRVLRAG
ncbi:hypothetical protein IQ16_07550, partial [Bradyrhizobium huanghuaihaiense]